MRPQTAARPRPATDVIADIHDELYAAVYAGYLGIARERLDEIAMVSGPGALGDRLRTLKRDAELKRRAAMDRLQQLGEEREAGL